MKKTGVVAFCGSKGAGKSTASTLFKEMIGLPVEELALAEHLKTTCSEVFEIPLASFVEPHLKEVELENYVVLGKKELRSVLEKFNFQGFNEDQVIRPHLGRILQNPRQVLQYVGTNFLHPLDSLVHAKIVSGKKDPSKLSIITDMRFVAEFDHMKANFGDDFMPIYVKNSQAELVASSDKHPSETQLHQFKTKCLRLDNEVKSQDTLRENLKGVIKTLFGEL